MKKSILFICTHNSARSQIAEGIMKAIYGGFFEVFSAGTKPSTVNPYAVKVLKEIGIDISKNRSKSIDELEKKEFDYVVTLCDGAKEICPVFPNAGKRIHKSFKDPSDFKGSEDEILLGFRLIRDEIRNWIEETFKKTTKKGKL
ncbi:MAG: protein-tyrosine-phosphatase [Deltaproteobacteria bacterium]|jgi:arsenate reductase|nr:MAG: protein-tyrosine-phosphatase [Deltaproteobacteria bacterium]